ncbi:MAG: hypothetical protein PF541_01105 [Prolixibacteraceae bacterium]|jgi:hypothetical protein|nr:hypothetical protein [Prolixibacteraceae bacterium]
MKNQFTNLLEQFLKLKEHTENNIHNGSFSFIHESERISIVKRLQQLKEQINVLKNKFKITLAAGLLSLSLITFSANQLNAQSNPVKAASLSTLTQHSDNIPNGSLATSGVLLYSQFDNPAGNGAPAQNFETAFDVYDCDAADDIVVPAGKIWSIDEVEIAFSGTLPTPNTNVTVRFHEDNSGVPGTVIEEFVGFNINSTNFFSNGTIPLPTPVVLTEGTKWVSFHVNMDNGTYGQLFWSNSTVQKNNLSCWINPGNGFGTGATTWTPVPTANVGGGYPDLLFAVYGVEANTVPFSLFGTLFAFLGIAVLSFLGIRKKRKKTQLV